MKIDGYSEEIFRNLRPQNIRLFLSSCGWKPKGGNHKVDYFVDPHDRKMVTVPNSSEYIDYPRRVEEIIRTVSDVEDISVQRIVEGMSMASTSDTIEYRYRPKSGEVGLIPIDDLGMILKLGKDINLYAYHDLIEFKRKYSGTNWNRRKDLDAIRIGPCIPGSYVVQFVFPALQNPHSIQSNIDGGIVMDHPLYHEICEKIETSLTEVIHAAEYNRLTLDPELKISYNFVSSVAGLSFKNADIEVRRTVTYDSSGKNHQPMDLSSSIMQRISAIENNMRPVDSNDMVSIKGMLIQVNDTRSSTDDEPVRMKIRFFDEDRQVRTATFMVRSEDVPAAYDASMNRKLVSLSGNLVGPTRNRRIEEYTDFKTFD